MLKKTFLLSLFLIVLSLSFVYAIPLRIDLIDNEHQEFNNALGNAYIGESNYNIEHIIEPNFFERLIGREPTSYITNNNANSIIYEWNGITTNFILTDEYGNSLNDNIFLNQSDNSFEFGYNDESNETKLYSYIISSDKPLYDIKLNKNYTNYIRNYSSYYNYTLLVNESYVYNFYKIYNYIDSNKSWSEYRSYYDFEKICNKNYSDCQINVSDDRLTITIFFKSKGIVDPDIYTGDGCGTISDPGVYSLISDIHGDNSCIGVYSDNVTIDGNGYTLYFGEDNSDSAIGIIFYSQNNATLKNINIKDNSLTNGDVCQDFGLNCNSLGENDCNFLNHTYGVCEPYIKCNDYYFLDCSQLNEGSCLQTEGVCHTNYAYCQGTIQYCDRIYDAQSCLNAGCTVHPITAECDYYSVGLSCKDTYNNQFDCESNGCNWDSMFNVCSGLPTSNDCYNDLINSYPNTNCQSTAYDCSQTYSSCSNLLDCISANESACNVIGNNNGGCRWGFDSCQNKGSCENITQSNDCSIYGLGCSWVDYGHYLKGLRLTYGNIDILNNNITITKSLFSDSFYGDFVTGGNTRIINNSFINNKNNAVTFDNFIDSEFINNYIRSYICSLNMNILNNSNITNNNAYSNISYSLYGAIWRNSNILNNTFSSYSTLTNSIIFTDINLIGNKISSSDGNNGINIINPYSIISNSILKDNIINNSANGIYITGNSTNITLDNNTFYSNTRNLFLQKADRNNMFRNITFINQKLDSYRIDDNTTLNIINPYGEIRFTFSINNTGSNFSKDIIITNNSLYVNGSIKGFNKSADVVLYNLPNYENYTVLRNNLNTTINTTKIIHGNYADYYFKVSSWSNYSIYGEGILISNENEVTTIQTGSIFDILNSMSLGIGSFIKDITIPLVLFLLPLLILGIIIFLIYFVIHLIKGNINKK